MQMENAVLSRAIDPHLQVLFISELIVQVVFSANSDHVLQKSNICFSWFQMGVILYVTFWNALEVVLTLGVVVMEHNHKIILERLARSCDSVLTS